MNERTRYKKPLDILTQTRLLVRWIFLDVFGVFGKLVHSRMDAGQSPAAPIGSTSGQFLGHHSSALGRTSDLIAASFCPFLKL
jgi:hypothetical protein